MAIGHYDGSFDHIVVAMELTSPAHGDNKAAKLKAIMTAKCAAKHSN